MSFTTKDVVDQKSSSSMAGPHEPPAWQRLFAPMDDEQLDRFMADKARTAAIASRYLTASVEVQKGTHEALEMAQEYHAEVQDRMMRRKRALVEKEERTALIGKR
jgi:hypothetical protein